MSVRALVLLGVNLGDRQAALESALRALARLPKTRLAGRSRVYETAPVGPSRKPYLNMAAALDTELSPMGLLIEAKTLEAAAGRRPGRRWAARPLDVDIAAYGRARVKTPWLTLPHPRLEERAFALAPLADLEPRFGRLLRRLKPAPGTVKIFVSGSR